jgi:hypothetical protein
MFLDASESEMLKELWKQEKGLLYLPLMFDELCGNHTNLSLVPIEF